MRYIRNTIDFSLDSPTVVTLGKFNGLHRGHQKLIKRVLSHQEAGLKAVVFTFDVSPVSCLSGQKQQLLLTNSERADVLEAMGVDLLIECPFVREIMEMEAEDFIREYLVKRLHASCVVIGTDFHFGHCRRGTPELLKSVGQEYGFTVEILEKETDGTRDISSTYIREELAKGNIAKVNELLGYDYFVRSEIVHGRGMGGPVMGVPTINQVPENEKLLPPRGVYTTVTEVAGQNFGGVSNVGTKPTVDGGFMGVETHLFGCTSMLYGHEATVRFLNYQRKEQKFSSIDELRTQLALDEKNGKDFLIMYGQTFGYPL